jgi:hypothetical protein
MAEAQEFDPFVSTDEVELSPEELAELDELDTDDETQFISSEEFWNECTDGSSE